MTEHQRKLLTWASLTPCGWATTVAVGVVGWVVAPITFAVIVPVALVVSALEDRAAGRERSESDRSTV